MTPQTIVHQNQGPKVENDRVSFVIAISSQIYKTFSQVLTKVQYLI